MSLLVAAVSVRAQVAYPNTPVQPVVDRYHGVAVTDPYRWMEDMKSPQFQQWLKAQSEFAAAGLKSLPGREALRQRLGQLADSGVTTG
ncbi:MAG: S9 family peptidase, partial [Inhella sp.]